MKQLENTRKNRQAGRAMRESTHRQKNARINRKLDFN
jgi:hypothetical protein